LLSFQLIVDWSTAARATTITPTKTKTTTTTKNIDNNDDEVSNINTVKSIRKKSIALAYGVDISNNNNDNNRDGEEKKEDKKEEKGGERRRGKEGATTKEESKRRGQEKAIPYSYVRAVLMKFHSSLFSKLSLYFSLSLRVARRALCDVPSVSLSDDYTAFLDAVSRKQGFVISFVIVIIITISIIIVIITFL